MQGYEKAGYWAVKLLRSGFDMATRYVLTSNACH